MRSAGNQDRTRRFFPGCWVLRCWRGRRGGRLRVGAPPGVAARITRRDRTRAYRHGCTHGGAAMRGKRGLPLQVRGQQLKPRQRPGQENMATNLKTHRTLLARGGSHQTPSMSNEWRRVMHVADPHEEPRAQQHIRANRAAVRASVCSCALRRPAGYGSLGDTRRMRLCILRVI
jgi:hypothetical protein